jgi:Prokaryotic E2 family E
MALSACCPNAAVRDRADHSAVVAVPDLPLGPGWNQATTKVCFVVPTAYPAAQPDCFYTDPQLRLAGGQLPANSALNELDGRQLLWFSWHLASWHPHRDNLVSYLRFIERRLHDAR